MKLRRPSRDYTAFTLVELLVVIAIIGVLVALLLPAVQAAREAARRSQCSNNIKQQMLGVLNYESARRTLPAGMDVFSPLTDQAGFKTANSTWAIEILPYMEQQTLGDLFDFTRPISDLGNLHLIDNEIASFLCPSDAGPPEYESTNFENPAQISDVADVRPARSSYVGIAGMQYNNRFWSRPVNVLQPGPGGVPVIKPFARDDAEFQRRRGVFRLISQEVGIKRVKLQQVTDGTSNTVAIAEYHTLTIDDDGTFRPPAWGDWRSYSSMADATDVGTLDPANLGKRDQHEFVFGLPDFALCIQNIPSTNVPKVLCERAVASTHSGGVIQCGSLDGGVIILNDDLDPQIWGSLATYAGDEVVSDFR